jgi:hypothetical protein
MKEPSISEDGLDAAFEAFHYTEGDNGLKLIYALAAYVQAERDQVHMASAHRLADFLRTARLDMTGSYLNGRNGLRNAEELAVELLEVLGLSGTEMSRARFINILLEEVDDYRDFSDQEYAELVYDAIKKHGSIREK